MDLTSYDPFTYVGSVGGRLSAAGAVGSQRQEVISDRLRETEELVGKASTCKYIHALHQ